jgi:hypothetical protein
MVLCRNDAAAALLLANRPELHVVVAAVYAVDVVGPAVAGEGAFVLAAGLAGVVGAEILQDVCFTPCGPDVGPGLASVLHGSWLRMLTRYIQQGSCCSLG